MNFQTDKSQLESAFEVLKQQAAETSENWNDPVQRRFYDHFIDPLPKEFIEYINELNKIDKVFKSAEQHINNLQQ